MKKLLIITFILLFSFSVPASAVRLGPVDIYYPDLSVTNPSDGTNQFGVEYSRITELKYNSAANGTLLGTFEQTAPSTQMPVFPVYRSTDHGSTWSLLSNVQDTVNGWGLRWNPQIYELPASFGSLPAGTLLMAGLSIPQNFSQIKIVLYKSTDQGATWSYLSTMQSIAWNNGVNDGRGHNIWEPFLLLNNGTLICYFSDERNLSYNQAIVHISSTDGINWGPVVYDVAIDQTYRPGMPTIAKMGNGNYIMTYEMVGEPVGAQVFYKISADPQNWGAANSKGTGLAAKDGIIPMGSPYVVYTPNFGPNGMVIVSANYESTGDNVGGDYFVNYNNGTGNWYHMASPVMFNNSGGWNANRSGFAYTMVPSSFDNLTLYTWSDPHYEGSREKISFAAQEIGVQSGQNYKVNSNSSGKVLTVNGTAQDAPVTLAGDTDQTGQKFQFNLSSGGYFKIKNNNGGKLVTLVSGNLVQQTDSNSSNQLWLPQQSTTGEYMLVNQATGTSLTILDGSSNNTLWAIMFTNLAPRSDIQYQVDKPRVISAFGYNGNVELSWNKTFGATSYTIKRSTTSGGPYTTINTVSAKSYTDTTVLNGTTYYYVVSAANSVKTSADSNQVSAAPSSSINALLGENVIGTLGSWADNGDTTQKVFDHDWDTAFDALGADGAWAGLDLGSAKAVSQIRYAARFGYNSRMVGGIFQGANQPNFSDAVNLSTISTTPPEGYTTLSISNGTSFRYLRYLAPTGGHGNIAELELYGPSGTTGIKSGAIYKLVNPQSNKPLDVNLAGTANGTKVQIWDDNISLGQTWKITDRGDGTYKLINPNSNKALDVFQAGTANGTKVQIWDSLSNGNQQWAITYNGDGTYKLINPQSAKALDVAGVGTANGTSVQIWDDLGNAAQKWTIADMGNGTYKLTNPNSGKPLDVDGSGTANGTKVQIWEEGIAQKWAISDLGDGTYKLVNPNSSKALDVAGAGTANGTNVQIWDDFNGGVAQKWAITPRGDGTFKLINPNSNKALDVFQGGTANGTNIQIWDYYANGNQQWKLVKQY